MHAQQLLRCSHRLTAYVRTAEVFMSPIPTWDSHADQGQSLACRISTNKQSIMAMWTSQQLQQRTWSSTNSILLYLLKTITAVAFYCITKNLLFVLSNPVHTFPHVHTWATWNRLFITFLSILSSVGHFCLTFPDDDTWISINTQSSARESMSKCLPFCLLMATLA